PGATSGKDDDRHFSARSAPALEDRQPIHLRKPEVEHDQCVIFGIAEKPGFFTISRFFNEKAGGTQRRHQIREEARIVLNCKYTHQSSISRSRTRPFAASSFISITR